MNRIEALEKINNIFKDVLDDEDLEIREETTASDVEDWDSLNHIVLVVAIEKGFGKKFTAHEIQSWKNVGEMMDSILKE